LFVWATNLSLWSQELSQNKVCVIYLTGRDASLFSLEGYGALKKEHRIPFLLHRFTTYSSSTIASKRDEPSTTRPNTLWKGYIDEDYP